LNIDNPKKYNISSVAKKERKSIFENEICRIYFGISQKLPPFLYLSSSVFLHININKKSVGSSGTNSKGEK
jgi:hypothetical protein